MARFKFNPITGSLDLVESSSSSGTVSDIIEDVTCDASVSVGDVVRIASGVAYKAQADVKANARAIGIANAKSSSVLCDIVISGQTGNIFVGLDDQEDYLLSESTAGAITITQPTGHGNISLFIGRPFSSTSLIVNIGESDEINTN